MYYVFYKLHGKVEYSVAQTPQGALRLQAMHKQDPEKKFLYFINRETDKIVELSPEYPYETQL